MMKHYFNTKKTFILLSAVVMFSSLGATQAKAQVPGVFVPTYSAIEHTTATAHAAFQDIAKMTADTFAYTAGQLLLNQITDSTVNWIKSGFNGSPTFAVNPTQLFLDTANTVSGGMANQIRGIATCNFNPNFNNDLANMIDLATRNNATAKFNDMIRCPFTGLNVNATDFYSDFKNGGWVAFEASLSDSGNAFGVKLLANQELTARQAEAQRIKEQQLGWANGFLSIETCSGTDSYTGTPINCRTSTPGKVISDQLSKSMGTDMDRLGFADNMNKIISALIQQVTTQMISGSGIFR